MIAFFVDARGTRDECELLVEGAHASTRNVAALDFKCKFYVVTCFFSYFPHAYSMFSAVFETYGIIAYFAVTLLEI